MKYLLIFGIVLFINFDALSQSFNAKTTSNSKEHLIGKFSRTALEETPFLDWFETNYADYEVDNRKIEALQSPLSGCTITLFMGTWCGDSQKEVPRLYKVLDALDFPMERLTAVALDNKRANYKQSPGGEEEGLNNHRVPTIIVFKEGKEINRIVEHPKVNFESDLLAIVNEDYIPNYEIVHLVDEKIKTMGVQKFAKKRKKLAKKLKPVAEKYNALNTYSNVLFYANKQEEGVAVAELNQVLFPNEPTVYVGLANKYFFLKEFKKAKENYEKALFIDPDNKWATNGLKQLNSL